MTEKTFRRYTNLASAIHILQTKTITLLSPSSWDDENDRYFLNKYKEKKRLQSLLALCFAETSETYHHWKVFSQGHDGVCIEFDKARLLEILDEYPSITHRKVEYKTIDGARKSDQLNVVDLPFLKRWQFRDEGEYRIIYEDNEKDIYSYNISINLDIIKRIILSPWLHYNLSNTVEITLHGIDGCKKLRIHKSKLINYTDWKSIANNIVK